MKRKNLQKKFFLFIYFSILIGQDQVAQTIPLVPNHRLFDENMIVWKELPKLVVRVAVEEKWEMLSAKLTNLLSLTVESMYNIPTVMSPEMEYCVCTLLPSVESVSGFFLSVKFFKKILIGDFRQWNRLFCVMALIRVRETLIR